VTDQFDPENLRLSPEQTAVIGVKPKTGRQPKRARAEPFLNITLRAVAAGAGVLRGTKQYLVWLYIHHRVWADKSDTVTVANRTLESWGVGKREKRKALKLLEEAGLVSVEWRTRRSPLVTLRVEA
jgi:hypothetical protein